jgi:uncharacterized protein DUF3306
MAEPRGFLARWSRLKQEARRASPPAASEAAPGAPSAEPVPELPAIDSLTAESDFTPFMQPGVPEALRNAALQKLWRSDPLLANLDGLVEYGDDFAADFNAGAAVVTAYRVLQGMPEGSEPPPEPAAPQPEPDVAPAAPDGIELPEG